MHIRINGTGRFTRSNSLQQIERVEHVAILDPLDIRVRIDELKQLRAGWLDGKGVPLAPEGLDWLADSFDLRYPQTLPLPCLFPTPEGHVLIEWQHKTWAPSLEIDLDNRMARWHVLNLETDQDEEDTFNLANPEDWLRLITKLEPLFAETQ